MPSKVAAPKKCAQSRKLASSSLARSVTRNLKAMKAAKETRVSGSSARGTPKKRPSAAQSANDQPKKKCKSIISALAGVEALPPKLREVLSGLFKRTQGFGDSLPEPYRQAALDMACEAFRSEEMRLEKELKEALAKVDAAQEDKATREQHEKDAASYLEGLKAKITESKATLKESSNAIATCRHALKSAQSVQKASQVKLKSAAARLDQLQNVDEDMYQPLKAGAAHGTEGNRQLRGIQKVGKNFGFHEVMLDSVRAVLKKDLDKRRTFDGLVMDQLEAAFIKNYTIMKAALEDGQAEFQEQSEAVQEAQSRVDEAERAHEECNQTLADAQTALAPARAALVSARRNVRRFASDAQKNVQTLDLAEARLHDFRCGPLVSFEELRGAMKPSVSDVPTPAALEIQPTTGSSAGMQVPGTSANNVVEVQGDTHEVPTLASHELHPTMQSSLTMQVEGLSVSSATEVFQDNKHEVPTLASREFHPVMESSLTMQVEGLHARSATEIFQDTHEAGMLAVGDLVRLSVKGRDVQADYDWSGDALQPWEFGEVVEVGRNVKIRGPRGGVDEYEMDDLEKAESSSAQKDIIKNFTKAESSSAQKGADAFGAAFSRTRTQLDIAAD